MAEDSRFPSSMFRHFNSQLKVYLNITVSCHMQYKITIIVIQMETILKYIYYALLYYLHWEPFNRTHIWCPKSSLREHHHHHHHHHQTMTQGHNHYKSITLCFQHNIGTKITNWRLTYQPQSCPLKVWHRLRDVSDKQYHCFVVIVILKNCFRGG
jgi:hypothetical protein